LNAFYLTTGAITILVAVLGYLIWLKTKSVHFVFGAAAIYFWSIHGAWGLTYDKTVGSEEFRYHYLEASLFQVMLDHHYLTSLLIYGVFCLVTLTTTFLLVDSSKSEEVSRHSEKIPVNHTVILLFSLTSAAASFLIIANEFATAVVLGQTGYSAIGAETIEFFTIHQIFGRAALFSCLIGFTLLIAGQDNRYFESRSRPLHFAAYLLLAGGLIAYMMLLGNKNELFTGFVFAVLLFLGTHGRPPHRKTVLTGVVLFFLVASVDYFRGVALLSGGASEVSGSEVAAQTARIVFSNEAFAAHFSMYGAVKYDVGPTYGTGMNALLFSVVPINVWPDRPVGNYSYYAAEVGAEAGRGYTIHHATSWYIDFGIPGVILGALTLGAIWASLHNGFARTLPGALTIRRIFFLVAPFGFSAYMPGVIRAGVETYKGTFLGAVAIPMFFLILASIFCRPRSSDVSQRELRAST